MELRSLRERLKMRVAAELDLTRDVEDAEIARMIDRCILEETKDQFVENLESLRLNHLSKYTHEDFHLPHDQNS